MWVDTIIKQTLALADKSGLRRKPLKKDENKDGTKRKEYTPEQKKSLLSGLFAEVAKKLETDEQKAERIRNEINKK